MKTTNETGLDNNGTCVWNKLDTDVADSYSPPVLENSDVPDLQRNRVRLQSLIFFPFFRSNCEYILKFYICIQAFEELRAVFTAEFAHKAYMLFYRCIDSEMMQQILKNHERIKGLCHDYEQRIKTTFQNTGIYFCIKTLFFDYYAMC